MHLHYCLFCNIKVNSILKNVPEDALKLLFFWSVAGYKHVHHLFTNFVKEASGSVAFWLGMLSVRFSSQLGSIWVNNTHSDSHNHDYFHLGMIITVKCWYFFFLSYMRVPSNFIICVNEKLTLTISDWSVTLSSITSAKCSVIFDVFKIFAVLQTFTPSVFEKMWQHLLLKYMMSPLFW